MRISFIIFTAFILQSLSSAAISQEMVDDLVPLLRSPITTSSGVKGSLQCTMNSDESYAVCASLSNVAVKYNLRPFSFVAEGPNQDRKMTSCDLYEKDSQSTSRTVCVKGGGIVYFHRVSDMVNVATATIGVTGPYPHVTVDTPNEVAYVSNDYNNPSGIYKIVNIGSSTPIFASTLTSFGSGDEYPAAMLIIGGFLYVHFSMNTGSRLARIKMASFTWDQTVTFASEECWGGADTLANDDNFIYDLTLNGILVRCTYKNNNFARLDSLNTGLKYTKSLAISPDQKTLFVVSNGNSVLQMVDASSFSMFGNSVSVPNAFGRPIVTFSYVLAFCADSDLVFVFKYYPLFAPSGLFKKMLDVTDLIIDMIEVTQTTKLAVLIGCTTFTFLVFFYNKERKRAELAETQLQQEKQQSADKDRIILEKDTTIERLRQLLNLRPFVKDKLYQIDFVANEITPPADPNAFGTLLKVPSRNNSVLFQHVREELWNKLGSMIPTPAPVNRFTLESLDVIYSEISSLEIRMRRLQQLRTQNGKVFNPSSSSFSAEQLQILDALRGHFLQRPSNATNNTPNLINVFHGTTVDRLQSVVNGLVAVRSTDAGYFGSGVYTTTSIEYAAKYARGDFDGKNGPYPPRASDGCVPVVWCVAAVGVCYPLTTEKDYSMGRIHARIKVSDFFGTHLKPGYDCHCIAVNKSVGFQAVPRKDMQYMEIVFDQEVQVLPIAVLWVKSM